LVAESLLLGKYSGVWVVEWRLYVVERVL